MKDVRIRTGDIVVDGSGMRGIIVKEKNNLITSWTNGAWTSYNKATKYTDSSFQKTHCNDIDYKIIKVFRPSHAKSIAKTLTGEKSTYNGDLVWERKEENKSYTIDDKGLQEIYDEHDVCESARRDIESRLIEIKD